MFGLLSRNIMDTAELIKWGVGLNMKVARTMADLGEAESVEASH
ncbi:hypothetical protein [Phaeocystidibacter luteus]|nr:hypothetical protein [Phaeocystidibacter luteus]